MEASGSELDKIHYLTLSMKLPAEGIDAAYPDEAACLARLREVRWPGGEVCPRCEHRGSVPLGERGTHQCEKCRHQFSLTSSTVLHKSRIGIRAWFRATELIIQHRARDGVDFDITTHQLREKMGWSYAGAYRVRGLIVGDIRRGGTGLLRACVCGGALELPPDIARNSFDHLGWLLEMKWAKLLS
ncbi:transposase [Frigidibacter sp. MR17.14]|uniref:transposase n=1 Tax=Frigidibacter sp. MR17.14 TaxID=3126509 RepID=UPI00301312C6